MIPPQGAMTTSVASPSSSKRAGLGKLMLGIFVGLSLAAFFYFDLGQYLSLDGLKSNRARLLAFTEANYPVAVAMFVLGYCVVVGLSLPGGAIMTLAGGFLFGSLLGTLYVNVGATVGATLAFLVARYLLREWVEQKFGSRLDAIQQGFARNAFSYLMTLRLIPLFPFFSGQYGLGADQGQCGDLHGGDLLGHHSRQFCLCVCRPPTRHDQFTQGNRLAQCVARIHVTRSVSAGAYSL